MRTLHSLPHYVVGSALLCSTALLCSSRLPAQNSAAAQRITAAVDETSMSMLKGNVPPLARAEFDQGEAAASTQMTHMRLVLSRSSEQLAALDQYLAELQDKSSPNYHKWLTPVEFGKLYGPADSDVSALTAWLESHGLKLETVSPGRASIAFSGTVSQVEEAFHTSIHSFQANGNQFYSNTKDPMIPSALAPVVMGVAQLNTIRPRPHLHPASTGKFNPETMRLEMVSAARPDLTKGSGTANSPYFLYIVPGDAATIYDTPNSYNANFSSGTSYTGAGVKIGVGGDATITASVVTQYRNLFLGSSFATAPILNYCTSSSSCSSTPGSGYNTSDGDIDEAYIDAELSGGIAPGAAIYYYASTDLTTGIQAALDANIVDIFSLSFGDCESDMGTSNNAQLNTMWQQAATQGIAVTVSSGDSGSAGCDAVMTGSTNTPDAVGGLAVSGFASTPYNIAVGGTDFYALNNSFTTYVGTTNATYYRSAKGYIPESTWNDSTYTDTTISANKPWSAAGFPSSDNNIAAGSGGASAIYSKPAWQTGTGVPSDGKRDMPDVSLMSGDGSDSAAWLVCSSAIPKGSTTAPNCAPSGGSFSFVGFGGTSTAAPTFAGILALVEQASGGRLGQAAKTLYELYNGSNANSIFHDQNKVGNNSVACNSGTLNCVKDSAGYYFESGYNTASSGYDLATGLGSVDVAQLVNYWSSSTGSATTTVGVTPTPNPVTTVESLSVPVSVTGGRGTPTGTVTLSGGGYTSPAETLVGGSYTFNIAAGSLSIGSDMLTVTYSGDSVYASGVGTASVTVTGGSSSPTFALSAMTPTAVSPGASTMSTITVSSTTGYAGTVTLNCALTAGPTNPTGDAPTCSITTGSPVTLSGTTKSGTATAMVSTTSASGELVFPKMPGRGRGWAGAGGGAVLALLIFVGMPARRRNWRQMLGVLVVMAGLGSMAGCGGGGGGGTTIISNLGTTAGNYTFTVTGTGNPAVTPAPTTTFTVTVN